MSQTGSDYANQLAAQVYLRRLRLELARRLVIRFCQVVHDGFIVAPHHQLIAEKLDQVAAGDLRRLIISMPPRHGKSEMASVLFPAYWLGLNPIKQIIHVSYAAALSNEFARRVRSIVRDDPQYRRLFPEVALDPERQRLDDWKLTAGGGFKSIGVQGGISGHGADLLIIDDPVKEGDEKSLTTLQAVFDWYLSAARTRLSPGAAVVVIMTRWHPLDLVGQLLELAERDPLADQWEQLTLPALAGENDPLGRAPGQALWPERFSEQDLISIRSLSERYFEALFQQNPQVTDAPMFLAEDFHRAPVGSVSDYKNCVWTFDLAMTEGNRADYNVFGRWAFVDGDLYLLEVRRFRAQWPEVKNALLAVAEAYPSDLLVFPNEFLELVALQMLRSEYGLAGRVKAQPLDGDKVARAQVLADFAKSGRVMVCSGPEGDAFVREHCQFPDLAQHDDCVDMSSVAAAYFGLGRRFSWAIVEIERKRAPDTILAQVGR
jgi:predicted phage terminase large subunit-like protein